MVLSQPAIRKAVKEKRIIFDPHLEEDQWGEASVDLRLGFSFTILENLGDIKVSVARGLQNLGKLGFWKTDTLKEQNEFGHLNSFLLKPHHFVLGMTHESVTIPLDLIGLVEGRTTYARVGLSMHQTAPWIQPGWNGPIVLEIINNGTLDIESHAAYRSSLPTVVLKARQKVTRTFRVWATSKRCVSGSEASVQSREGKELTLPGLPITIKW